VPPQQEPQHDSP
jgi:hypothetical protein